MNMKNNTKIESEIRNKIKSKKKIKNLKQIFVTLPLALAMSNSVLADQVILDDLIIDGSICAGMDCVNGESFGFDTIRLKENNLRIKFQDTSSSASFPSNDWQITVNDSANGGANKFSIDDIDGGRTPFTIEASAPSHSLYVDDAGRIGLGISNPVVEMHIKDGDSPTIRLEQDGTSGFTPQTWDIAGNETNFFVRDATNGSKLPFRIRPSAPSNSIYVDTDGDIGLGTASPQADLHVVTNNTNSLLVGNTDTDYKMLVTNNGKTNIESDYFNSDNSTCGGDDGGLAVNCGRFSGVVNLEENNSSTAGRTILALKNNAPGWISMEDTIQNKLWYFANTSEGLSIALYDKTANIITVPLKIKNNGDVVVAGVLEQSSSKFLKDNIAEVDYEDILHTIDSLAIKQWSYIKDQGQVKHIGPMAQDFYDVFKIGSDEEHISSIDTSGVSLAAIKALHNKVKVLENRIEQLLKIDQ